MSSRAKRISIQDSEVLEFGQVKRKALRPLNDSQARYIGAIQSNILTIGVGPAGVGKTMIAAALAADAFVEREIDQIIITRPAVDAGNSLGFLPGELHEKFEPYIAPLANVLLSRLGRSQYEYAVKAGQIKIIPLEHARGLSWNDTWVILDEAQNTTRTQMKMFLTRIGRNCKAIVNGDPDQSDVYGDSGLHDALRRLSNIPDVSIVEFTWDDVVRSPLVKSILRAYAT